MVMQQLERLERRLIDGGECADDYVAIAGRRDLIDAGVVKSGRTCRPPRDEVWHSAFSPPYRKGVSDARRSLHGTGPGDQRADAAAQSGPVFGRGGYNAESSLRTEAGKGPVPAHARRS